MTPQVKPNRLPVKKEIKGNPDCAENLKNPSRIIGRTPIKINKYIRLPVNNF